jgi:tape measure domain-containing protein
MDLATLGINIKYKDVSDASREMQKAQQSATGLADAMEKAQKKTNEFSSNAKKATDQLAQSQENLAKKYQQTTSEQDKLLRATEQTRSATEKARNETDKYGNSLTEADKQAGRFIDSSGRMREANGRFVAGANKANESLSETSKAMRKAKNESDILGDGIDKLKGFFLGFIAISTAKEIIKAADAYTSMQNQLRLVTDTARELITVQAELNRVANDTYSSQTVMAKLYNTMQPALKDMGRTTFETTRFVETFSKALALTSPTVQESQSVILQFSQAMGSGVLRGDEFNSMMENGRGVMMALADGLGVGIGALRKMAEEGKLTSDIVAQALESQRQAVDQKFGEMQMTVSQAWQVMTNEAINFVGALDSVGNSSSGLANVIKSLAEVLQESTANINRYAEASKFADQAVGKLSETNTGFIDTLMNVSAEYEKNAYKMAYAAGTVIDKWGFVFDLMAKGAASLVNDTIDMSQELEKYKINIGLASDKQEIFNASLDGSTKAMSDTEKQAKALGVSTYDLSTQYGQLYAQTAGFGTQQEMLLDQEKAFGNTLLDVANEMRNYGVEIDETNKKTDKGQDVIKSLEQEYKMLGMSIKDAAIAKALFKAGLDLDSNTAESAKIRELVTANYNLSEAKKSATTTSKAYAKQIKDESKSTEEATKKHLEYLKAIQNDDYDAFEKNIKSIEDYNKSQTDSLKSLQDTLNPTMALYRKYGEDVLLLNQQFAQGNMYVADYEGAIGSLKNKLIKDVDGIETYSKSVKTLSESLKDFGNVSFSKTSDPLVDSMGSLLETTGKMMSYYDQEKQHLDDIAKKRAEIANTQFASDKERAQAIQSLGKLESDFTANATRGSLAMYSNMAGAAAGLFDQNSKEQKALMQVQKAMTIATLALDAQKMASSLGLIGIKTTEATVAGTAAVLTQGSGDPYSAWVRMAAMAATVGALLGAIGGGSPSVSGSSVPQAKGGDGASSPLGSTDPSKSASESLKYMQDIEANQYKELRNIFKEMQDLNSSITGFATALYTTGDIRSIGTNVSGLGTTYNTQGIVDFCKSISKSLGLYDMPIIGGLIKGLDSFAGDLLNSAFGGTTKKAVGSGIYLGDFSLGQNADLQSYTRIKKTSSGPFGSFSSSDRYDSFQDIQGQSEQAFQNIFDNLHDGMIDIGTALGQDITAKVDAFKISIGKIETSGKTGAEIEQALQEAISTQTDKLAYAMFPDMVNKYAKLNEGYFETLTRLVTDKAVVTQTLGDIGIKINGDVIAVSEALVELSGGLNDFVSNTNDFVDAFYTDEQKQKINTDSVTNLFDGLSKKLPATEAGLVRLISGLKLQNEAEYKTYTAIMDNVGALDQYYESLKTAKQTALDAKNAEKSKTADLKQQLLELTNPTKALKQARDAELKGLTATQQATQKRIWALQDEKTALDNLKNAQANYQSSLKSLYDFGQNIKDTITGIQQEAIQQKDSAQSAFDGSAKSIADYANNLTAQMAQINADIAKNFKEVSTTVSDYLDSLKLDKNDTNAEKLTYYRNTFATTLSKANAGDIEAAKALPEISQNLLDASYAQASSFEDYLKEKSTVASKLYAVEALATAKYTASQKTATSESDDLTEKLKSLQSDYDLLTSKVKDAGGDIGEIVTKFGSTSSEIDGLISEFVASKTSLADTTKQYYDVRANEMVALSSLVDQYNASVILLNLYNKEITGIDFASVSDPLLAFKTGLNDVVTAFNTAKAELATAQKTAANASVAVATAPVTPTAKPATAPVTATAKPATAPVTATAKPATAPVTPTAKPATTLNANQTALAALDKANASATTIINLIDSKNMTASGVEKALGVDLNANQSGLIKLISSGATTAQIGNYIDSKNMTITGVSQALGITGASARSTLGSVTSKFADGGYTGNGGKYEPAGVVHKGEYVIPKWQVEKYPHAIRELEGVRRKGYADGGMVSAPMAITSNSNNGDIIAELKALRNEVSELKAQDRQIGFEVIKNTKTVADYSDKWDANGMPINTEIEVNI